MLQTCTWLANLALELQQIEPTEFIDSRIVINPDIDTVVGEMTDDHKRLYTLCQNIERTAAEALVEANYTQDETARQRAEARVRECKKKSEAILNLFWISVNDHFNLWSHDSTGVRKGFQVVWTKIETPENFLDFLRGMGR